MQMKNNSKGQSLLELVVGIGLVAVVVGAIAIVTLSSLRNTQFSKNQLQATNLAQQNLERVRTIKNSNSGVCLQNQNPGGDPPVYCSVWEDLWAVNFGTTCSAGCTFEVKINSEDCEIGADKFTGLCLKYNPERVSLGLLSTQIIIEDEDDGNGVPDAGDVDTAKRITSRVFWTDSSGEHSSDLVTILSRR